MRAPGNKLLAAFLGLSVVFFAVAMFVGEDAPDEPAWARRSIRTWRRGVMAHEAVFLL